MTIKSRKTLKEFFKTGSMPTEAGFENLIDSMINKLDDGISKDSSYGLKLMPSSDSDQVISFYKNLEEDSPLWDISLDTPKQENKDLQNNESDGLSINENGGESRIFLKPGGNVGIGTMTPSEKLEVAGNISSIGRVGIKGEINADGQWHSISQKLTKAAAFEIVARVGEKKTGRHALLHAIATSTYGKSDYSISKTQARFSFWRKCTIEVRFSGDLYNYHLQIRTRHNEGSDVRIYYHITQLWNDDDMIPGVF